MTDPDGVEVGIHKTHEGWSAKYWNGPFHTYWHALRLGVFDDEFVWSQEPQIRQRCRRCYEQITQTIPVQGEVR